MAERLRGLGWNIGLQRATYRAGLRCKLQPRFWDVGLHTLLTDQLLQSRLECLQRRSFERADVQRGLQDRILQRRALAYLYAGAHDEIARLPPRDQHPPNFGMTPR